MRIETTETVYRHRGWPYVPAETITAQMNLPYTAAVTLLEGTVFVDQYTDEKLRDPKILDLAGRVEVVVVSDLEALGPREMRAVRVSVTMKSGEVFKERVLYRSGHWKNPLSDETLASKFRDLAGRVLQPDAVTNIEAIVWGLDKQPNPGGALAAELGKLKAAH